MPKVVLQANDEVELQHLLEMAIQAGLPTCLVEDAGRTVVAAGTITCLGLGPADNKEIDVLTGELKLL
jgi:peptidyl-tRNA hydrolase